MMPRLLRLTTPVLALLSTLGACSHSAEQALPSGIDESFLDRSTDPCTDFYQFACGTWIKEHPADTSASVQRFFEGEGRNEYLLTKILDGDRIGAPYVPHAAASALGTYYGACMASRVAGLVDHTLVDQRLANVAAVTSLAGLASVLGRLHADGISAFFWIYASVDPGNPGRRVATFVPAGLSFDESYYLDTTMSVLPRYEDHVRALSMEYGGAVAIDPAGVVTVETALAQASLMEAAARDPVATYNLLATDAFTSTASHFPWTSYLAASGLASIADVDVTQPGYLMALDALVASTPLDSLKNYLSWRILEEYAHTLGKTLVTEEAKFHYGVFTGDPSVPPDWWACLESTRWALGFALSQPFVDVRFNAAEREGAKAILASIKEAFRAELGTRDWLDMDTRAAAESKLDQIVDKIGFPDAWPSLPPVDLTGNYAGNVFAMSNYFAGRYLALLGETPDRAAWSVAPCTTNAFYSPLFNEIVFPAAILQTPEYGVGRPAALNYGAIGAIMGHELTHGFDDSGRHFDGGGKLVDWWAPGVEGEFVRRASCLVDRYSGYEAVPGVKVDGAATLGENIADLGGLRLAYAAYKARVGGESFAGSFDADQQFFLANAQLFCASFKDELVVNRVRSDVHSPPKFRVNGVVSNLPEFAAAFNCAPGSPMAPADRCDVW